MTSKMNTAIKLNRFYIQQLVCDGLMVRESIDSKSEDLCSIALPSQRKIVKINIQNFSA